MACYKPFKAFDTGEFTKNGKPKYKICDFRVDHIELRNDTWQSCYDPFVSRGVPVRRRFVTVPCGQCIGCRLEYAKQWAMRCMLESQEHESSYFLTITYDDNFLRPCSGVDTDGQIRDGFTLDKKDLQNFWKMLRADGQKIRYYACGEYGTHTFRPHYHAIVFGLQLHDLVLYKVSPRGDRYYNSRYLDSIWKKGYIVVGEVTFESCAYTARYVAKKVHEDLSDIYAAYGMQPEFVVMSRRPGIAYNYVKTHPDLFDNSCMFLSTLQGSIRGNIPRYFKKVGRDQILDDLYFDHSAYHSGLRSEVERSVVEHDLDMSYVDYLETLEGKKLRQIRSLTRDKL